jgi:autotransporter-associated beta strand protein
MKPKSILAAATVACTASAQAADLTWNAALPGNWDTSTANWTGSTWNNTTPDNAIFNNLSGTITLTEAITGGSLSFNAAGRESGVHVLTLTGSGLSLGSIGVVGTGLGGNVDNIGEAYNQRLTFENMTVDVSGSAAVGRGMLYLNGATMTVGGTILANNAWNVFRADNSTLTATGGIDLSSIASQVELYGGTVTTPSIKVGNYTFSGGGGGLYLSGVTLVATQDNTDFIQVYNDGNTASRAGARLYGNGVILDSDGHAVTIDTVLFGDGFLTKTGAGTLTLSQNNTYTSNTSVNEGMLEITATGKLYGGGYIYGPVVTVASGTTLRLNEWNYNAAGSLGNLDFSRELLVINGGTIEYAGNTNDDSNPGAAGRNFTVGTGGATLNVTTAGQTLTITDNVNYGALINNNGLTLGGVGNGVIGKVISGTGALTKSGSGTWTLTGANTYTGTTTVNEGTLSLTSPSLDKASSVVIGTTPGATMNLNFSGYDLISGLEINGSGALPPGLYNSSHGTYGSSFTGSGTLVVITDASGSWTSLADGDWDNPTNWNANTIATGIDQTATFNQATGVTVTLTSNQIIGNLAFDTSDYTLGGSSTLTLETSSGTPAISVGADRTATINANLGGTFGLDKTGAGTLVLTAPNAFSGETLVSGGLLQLGASPASNPQFGVLENSSLLTIESGATVRAMGANAFKGFSGGSMDLTLNGGTLTINDGVTEGGNHGLGFVTLNGGTISGVGGATYGGYNLNDAVDVIENSTISATNTNTNGTPKTITVSAGKTLDWTGTISNRGIDNAVSSLVFEGTGTTVLSGINTYTGNTTINEGTLVLADDARLTFAVTEAPAATMVTGTGTATFNGDFAIDTSAITGTNGFIWLLVDRANLTGESFEPTFNLIGFTQQGDGVTWTMSDAKGDWSFSENSGELTLDVGSDYDDWVTANGVVGTETDDDDNDGLTNFEEYAFGLDPTGGSSVNPITSQLDKATKKFSYTRRATNLPDPALTYSVWFSTDLGTWTQDTGATEGAPVLNGEVETVEVTLSALPGDPLPGKLFIQVRAQ